MGTIRYQDAGFYTSFFKRVEGFTLVDEFRESTEENEKDLYIGMIEAVGSVHQLRIRVEIPKSFPYAKLTFRTKSLKGYPHLIYNGKTKVWLLVLSQHNICRDCRRTTESRGHKIE